MKAPVGIDIGARTPEEIAISIISEILSFRLGGSNRAMMLEKKYIDNIRTKTTNTIR